MITLLGVLAASLLTCGLVLYVKEIFDSPWLLLAIAAFCLLRAWSVYRKNAPKDSVDSEGEGSILHGEAQPVTGDSPCLRLVR